MEARLGNVSPLNVEDDGSPHVTTVRFPDGTTVAEAFRNVTDRNGVWEAHSSAAPAWVASDSPGLEALLAEHFGAQAGEPDDLEATHWTEHGPPGVGPAGGES